MLVSKIKGFMENENKAENFFDKFGLQVTSGDVSEGTTYPIYAMITKILSDEVGSVQVELNFNIRANLTISDPDKIETLRERAFEPGIFISTVVNNGTEIEVDCHTIVFGKKDLPMV